MIESNNFNFYHLNSVLLFAVFAYSRGSTVLIETLLSGAGLVRSHSDEELLLKNSSPGSFLISGPYRTISPRYTLDYFSNPNAADFRTAPVIFPTEQVLIWYEFNR